LKAVEIVNRALNLSGILSRTLDQEDDEEGTDGLFWLNRLLEEKSAKGTLLPYYGHVQITAVVGQEIYFIPGLITADVLTFSLQGVRYPVRGQRRNKYFGSARAENVNSLPYQWYWERVNGGMNVYLYFFPADAYSLVITGLLALSNVDFDTELDDSLDRFYQNFLMFELAESLCIFYKMSLPPETKIKLERLRNEMKTINPLDFSIKKRSMMGDRGVLSYAQINISPGWTA
jgi:hypothetical protein